MHTTDNRPPATASEGKLNPTRGSDDSIAITAPGRADRSN